MPEKMQRNLALRRRIAPFTPLDLLLDEPDGKIKIELKLAFNMNAAAAIQEKTTPFTGIEEGQIGDKLIEVPRHYADGLLLTDTAIWKYVGNPRVLRAMLWAASLAHQPEYEADDGLETIGSYIQEDNSEAIVEALWKAYLAYLPAPKRELLLKAKADAEKRAKSGKQGDETNRPLDGTKPPAAETIPSAPSNSGPLPDTTSELKASTNSAS